MVSKGSPIPTLLMALLLVLPLAGCELLKSWNWSQVKLTPAADKAAPRPANPQSLSGTWEIAYQYGNQTIHATMYLHQDGIRLTGEGTDHKTDKHFTIEQGQYNGEQVVFYKRYSPGGTPIEYGGRVEVVAERDYQGPYMSGEYLAQGRGQEVRGLWEAQLIKADPQTNPPPAAGPGAPAGPAPGQVEGQTAPPGGKPPDLSGKWEVGFKYKFQTIHSVMFIEQHGDKLKGHGIDEETKEKFVIEKGWYSYPRVTLVRRYMAIPKGAKQVKPKPARSMTFKAEVSWVSDRDYQGPYMKGETEGGGDWEAQRIH